MKALVKWSRLFSLILTLGWVSPLFASISAETILNRSNLEGYLVNGSEDGQSITSKFHFWLDESGVKTLDDALNAYQKGFFAHSSKSGVGSMSRAKNSVLWLLVTLDNKQSEKLSMVVEHPAASFYVTMHQYEANAGWKHYTNGFLALNENLDSDYRYPFFPVQLTPGKNLFLFEIRAVEKEVVFSLWNPKAFRKHQHFDSMIIHFAFGGLIIICIYNFLTYLITRNREYMIYSGYLFCFLAIQGFLQGVGAKVFGQNAGAILVEPLQWWVGLTIIFMQVFVCKFFSLHRTMKRIARTFEIMNVMTILSCIVSLFDNTLGSLGLMIMAVPSILLTAYAGFRALREGFRPALYFLQSFGVLGIGVLIFLLGRVDIFNSSTLFARSALMLGGLAEAVLLSMAIGNKIALALQEQNQRILDEEKKRRHAYKQMAKVFFPHQMERIENGDALENTMPTHPAEACVISFDIIGSSRIKHERTKEFFRNLFRRCNEAMMENYEEKHLKANAYRIKEMGDGFLCSVGYPFQSETGQIAEDALALAARFQRILDEESRILNPEEPICCGIGIAFDQIVGFYPESGTREYDLFGRAIVLATRYEASRNQIFQPGQQGNIIILQERVYNSLGRGSRRGYIKLDLKAERLSVRDDATASCLYYRIDNPEAQVLVQPLSTAS